MRRTRLLWGLLAFMATPVLVSAQINFNNISSVSARDWRQTSTGIDSLWIETEAGNGQATTVITMVLNPGYYYSNTYVRTDSMICGDVRYAVKDVPDSLPCKPITTVVWSNPQALDSVEISTRFQLPSDFVASNLYLWVDGVRQTGEIQDRALANQQYTQIVGRRQDPALLEFFGNGSYSLRIFPAATNKPRKVAIEFRHTFDDDTLSLITAPIPMTFDSALLAYQYAAKPGPRAVGYIRASFTSSDNREYEVSLPGVGRGTFSGSRSLVLTARSVSVLGVGTVNTTDPSGASAEYAWAGRDEKTDKVNVGFAVELSERSLVFEQEPQTRILVFDIRSAKWCWSEYYDERSSAMGYTRTVTGQYVYEDILVRAKKFALMSLNAYVTPKHLFNVVIAGATTQTVFGAPVAGTVENLAAAGAAILSATADPKASTVQALRAAALQASSGITILVSDLYQPFDGSLYVNNVYTRTASGKAYDTLLSLIQNVIRSAGITLFTVGDDWLLNQMSVNSGGYRLASLLYSYGVQYRYEVVDGRRVMVPIMSPLFGSNNPGGYRDITIAGLDNAVHTIDGYNYGWWFGPVIDGPEIMVDAVRKTAAADRLVLPGYGSSSLLRVAGTGSPSRVTVTGKLGGLKFSQTYPLWVDYNPIISSHRPQVDKQWAFRRSEYLANMDWQKYAFDIKAIGKEYHIVTRQTSLLALEPGMKLLEDTLWVQQQQARSEGMTVTESAPDATSDAAFRLGGAPTANYVTSSGGVNVDDVEIEELLGLAIRRGVSRSAEGDIAAIAAGRAIRISLPALPEGKDALVRLYDARGRLAVSRRVRAADLVNGSVVLGTDAKLARGLYTLRVTAGSTTTVLRIPLM